MNNLNTERSTRPPIAVFAYNRPDKLASLFSTLQNCNGFHDSHVRIFVDGFRGESDRKSVEAVRNYVTSLDYPNVSHTFQSQNLGLRRSIYSGVSRLIDEFGEVIVLEDDLILSPIALDYFESGLREYEDETRVWSIAGYIYDAPEFRNSTRTLALPFTHPWGWATWKRAWKQFDLDSRPDIEDINTRFFEKSFNMNGIYPFTKQLKNSLSGIVDSWSVHWYYTVFKHGGVSIFPPRRVVDNLGLNAGTHASSFNPYTRLVATPPLLDVMPVFCELDRVDYIAMDALRQCRELRVRRFISHAGTAKRTLISKKYRLK